MSSEADHLIKIAVLETEVRCLKENAAACDIEYKRRLDELNHAHAMATIDKNKFVNVDLFYSKIDESAKWRSEMDQWRSKILGIAIGVALAAGMAGGGIAGLIARFMAQK